MKSLTEQLSSYAQYHRDRRNIATHFVGIPMITFAVAVLTSRPVFGSPIGALSPAWGLTALAALFYLRLELRLGLTMTALLSASALAAAQVAAQGTSLWLAVGLGGFVVGWIIQFIGHAFEGKKPAFVDDLIGLLQGPLFVLCEALFAIGLRHDLKAAIEGAAGPTMVRTPQMRAALRSNA